MQCDVPTAWKISRVRCVLSTEKSFSEVRGKRSTKVQGDLWP